MPYVYIGRHIHHQGKSLWDHVMKLKNFGEGRIFVRGDDLHKHKEPCYFKIIKATPMIEGVTKGEILVEEVHKGRPMKGIQDLARYAFKINYQLISKHKEHELIAAAEEVSKTPLEVQIYPKTMDLPPLLKFWAEQHGLRSEMDITMEETDEKRICKDAEAPNTTVSIGLGIPLSPHLYDHLNENS